MQDAAFACTAPSLDDVVIRVSIGIGRNITEAEHSLKRAKQRKKEKRYYNIDIYQGDPLPAPVEEPSPVVESFMRLERRLTLEGHQDSLGDLYNLKHDYKTGLLNKVGYAVEVQKLRDRYAYDDRLIILIDGDDMKRANSTLGYEETDRYIEAIGRALQQQVRQTAFTKKGLREPDVLVNRKNDSGGDEFIVDIDCPYENAVQVAMRYVDAMYSAQAGLARTGQGGGCGRP